MEHIQHTLQHLNDRTPESMLLLVVVTIAVCALIIWIGTPIITWLFRHLFVTRYQRTLHKKDLEKRQNTISALLANFWKIVVVFGALFTLIGTWFGPSALSPLFASAGIIGVAIGFGAQSLVKDFLSGVFIITENQYRVGDVIEIEGFGGSVERIGIRSTVIRDVDGNVHYFPNGMVQHVINKTMGYSMARFTVAVDPETDLKRTSKLIDRIGKDLAADPEWAGKIIEAPAYVMMGDFTANAVNLIISGKTQPSDQWSVVAEMKRRLFEQFEQEGIKLGAVPLAITSSSKKK